MIIMRLRWISGLLVNVLFNLLFRNRRVLLNNLI
jgi:hypothetical protein